MHGFRRVPPFRRVSPFRRIPSRWLVLAGVFGALTALTLLEAAPHIEGTFSAAPSGPFTGKTLTGNAPAIPYTLGGGAGSKHRRVTTDSRLFTNTPASRAAANGPWRLAVGAGPSAAAGPGPSAPADGMPGS